MAKIWSIIVAVFQFFFSPSVSYVVTKSIKLESNGKMRKGLDSYLIREVELEN